MKHQLKSEHRERRKTQQSQSFLKTPVLLCHQSLVDCWTAPQSTHSSLSTPTTEWTKEATKTHQLTTGDHKETMSSSSAMQTVFLIAAIASQAAAFNPSRAISVQHRMSTTTSSLKYLHNLPLSNPRRNSEQLSMNFNFGRNKGKKGISESTAIQSSTASLDGTKSESKNPITRWIQSVSWPSKKELKKLLPLGAMLFFILFNYTILRDTKVRPPLFHVNSVHHQWPSNISLWYRTY